MAAACSGLYFMFLDPPPPFRRFWIRYWYARSLNAQSATPCQCIALVSSGSSTGADLRGTWPPLTLQDSWISTWRRRGHAIPSPHVQQNFTRFLDQHLGAKGPCYPLPSCPAKFYKIPGSAPGGEGAMLSSPPLMSIKILQDSWISTWGRRGHAIPSPHVQQNFTRFLDQHLGAKGPCYLLPSYPAKYSHEKMAVGSGSVYFMLPPPWKFRIRYC